MKFVQEDNSLSLVSSTLSGTTGGALIGSTFGILGGVVGGIVGGIITGYSGYVNENKIAKRRKKTNT